MVGYSADLGAFILATRKGAKTGAFLLPFDESLTQELDRAQRSEASPAPAPVRAIGAGSALTPREIQARIRSGRTLEEVAEEAGVSVDWVDRFAAPVLAEQAAAVERAGRAILHTPRRGASDRPLEASVRRNLADRGMAMAEDDFQGAWSARHLVDGDWLVAFGFRKRGRPMTAEWVINMGNGSLTARNRTGADLGYIDPDHSPQAVPVSAAAGPVVGRPSARRTDSDRVPAEKAPSRKPPAGKVPASKPPAARAASGAAAAGNAPAGKSPPAARAAAGAAAAGKTPPGRNRVRKVSPAQVPSGEVPPKTAAAPRRTPLSRATVVALPPPPRPAGAHYARRSPPDQAGPASAAPAAPSAAPAGDRPGSRRARVHRGDRAAPHGGAPEPLQLPLGQADAAPGTGSPRSGNRD